MKNKVDIQDNEKELEEKKKAAHREAQKRYREKTGYAKEKEYKSKVKRIPLDVSMDFFKTIDMHILTTKEPRNVFIKRAIAETIERDNKK